MADHARIRDSIHRRLLEIRICGPEYAVFLRSRKDTGMLVTLLTQNMPFLLENACLSEEELMSLMDDPAVDLSPAFGHILAWLVKTARVEALHWFLAQADQSKLYADAMHWAACAGSVEILRVLLEHGAKANADDSAPLRYAAAHGQLAAVQLLIAAGADPSAREYEAHRLATLGNHHSIAALVAQH